MQINFRLSINTVTLPLFFLIIINTSSSSFCQPYSYSTNFTRCHIQMDKCTHNGTSYLFKKCQIEHCLTMGIDNTCKNSMTIELEESDCYHSCCESTHFDPTSCAVSNLRLAQRSEIANGTIGIILGVCVLGLLLFAVCFLVTKIQCFKKKIVIQEEPQLPIWRGHTFNDLKCELCQQYGAEVETLCKHSFHFHCLKNSKKDSSGKCISCRGQIKRVRLWCGECHQRYIKVQCKDKEIVDFEDYYHNAKIMHLDCMQDTISAKTDVRLTSTDSNS